MQYKLRVSHLSQGLWQRGRRHALGLGIVLVLFLASAVGSGRLAVASHASHGTSQLIGMSGATFQEQRLNLVPATLRRFAELGAQVDQQSAMTTPLGTFDATGLPAGTATGVASHTIASPGFELKHTHGGPGYAFVVAGYLVLDDGDGQTITYHAGEFFWEPTGHVHSVSTPEGAEWYTLRFLVPGAVSTIPVP